jgi:IS30 family transposase
MAENRKKNSTLNGNGTNGIGRPRLEIDWKEFDKLCAIQCSLREIAAWFECSDKTIERKVREHSGSSFAEYFAKKRVKGLISLRHNMFQMSERNPAVAIFLAKNLLGMSDKQEVQHSGNIGNNPSDLSDEELLGIIERRRSRGTAKETEGS